VRQSAVSFKTKGLTFEGVMAQPEGEESGLPGVVICHPHPLYGGNMDNNVVLAVSYGLVEQGFATLRFNFRGVGNSEGQHTKGEQESQEVLAALELMKAWPSVDSKRVGLAGYSFGSGVVLGNAPLHKKAKAFALISPSLQALENSPLKKGKQPAFIITGDQDKLAQSGQMDSVLDTFSQRPTIHVVAGADHFWGGHEDEMVPEVCRHFSEHLK